MTPFRERNPVLIGAISIAVIIALLTLALEAGKIPFLGGGGTTVNADFSDASGLQPGDDVLLAGVKVGKVSSIKIAGPHVDVAFTVKGDYPLGDDTRADIKIETLLGKMYVAVSPAGTGTLHTAIPPSRTSSPLSVTDAFIGLGQRAGGIDAGRLAKSFDTVAAAFKGTPPHVRSSLRGLSRLSQTIASRNTQIRRLLSDTRGVTETLATRDAQIVKLINDSNLILTTVRQQAAVIHSLLIDTSAVSRQLSGLVADNQKVLGPALSELHQTLNILNANQSNLRQSLKLAAPFIRDFTDVLGNGRWFETILANLPAGLADSCLTGVSSKPVCLGGGQ